MSNAAQRVARKTKLRLIDDTTIHNRRDSITSNAHEPINPENQGPNQPTATRNSWGLTARRAAFAAHVANGSTLSNAYRLAYEPKASVPAAQIAKRAHELAKHAGVVGYISAIKAERDRRSSHCETDLRTFVLTGLRKEAMDGDSSAARIRAMELLGKVTEIGLFTERSSTEVLDKRDESEVKAELLQRLNKLIPDNVE